ncbi:MAG TPA: sodium/proline symporter PutP [Bacillales bacterium]
MNLETGTVISLVVYMVAMLGIGYWSFKKTSTLSDYMLAGRGLGPWVTALSAGASDMSGWMVMGLPGALYVTGLSSAWIAIGLSIGAYVNYLVVAPRLRTYTEIANDSITIPDFMEHRFADRSNILRLVSGIIILIFFTLYVSAGMVSGGKLFDSAFGFSYHSGVFLIAAIVVAYTLFGGFLAVSTTDFVQGCIMFIALVLVPFVTIGHIDGGTGAAIDLIKSVDPTRLDLFKGATVLGLIGFFAWGLGYFGQPHIIVRFMAIKSAKELKAARYINIIWMVIGLMGAMAVGLLGIAFFAQSGKELADPETVLIRFADLFFNPFITGFILAAILAAIMSTISSQLLVTSSAVTEDFYKTFFRRSATDKELVLVGRLAVLAVAIAGVLLSINPNETILNIVGQAWAGFGSAFGPVVLLSLHWKRMTKWGALAGMVVGGVTVIVWIVTGLGEYLYEMVPGFILSLVAVIIVSKLTEEPGTSVTDQFEEMEKKMAD